MLAVFKAGGAYLPLDPRHPTQRYAQVLEQSGSPLVLATRHPMNLMARSNQPRHQQPSDRSRRACHEHPHVELLSSWVYDP